MPKKIMIRSWLTRIPICISILLLLALFADGIGATLGCLSIQQFGLIRGAVLFLGFFIILYLWWMLLGFSIWLTWFYPKNITSWSILIIAAALATLTVSWRFQVVRPWTFDDPDPLATPEVVTIHMMSLTTLISFVTVLSSVMLSARLLRWTSQIKRKSQSK